VHPADVQKVVSLRRRSFVDVQKTELEFSAVAAPNPGTVRVRGFPPETSKDKLQLFFESRRNEGGTVAELRILKHHAPTAALVTFEDAEGE
jgi:hypothetical protein